MINYYKKNMKMCMKCKYLMWRWIFSLLVFGFLTIILELSMVRSPNLLIAKINVVVVAKIETVLEFIVSFKNISEYIKDYLFLSLRIFITNILAFQLKRKHYILLMEQKFYYSNYLDSYSILFFSITLPINSVYLENENDTLFNSIIHQIFLVELKIQIENYQKKNFRVAYLNSEPDTSKILLILLKLKLLFEWKIVHDRRYLDPSYNENEAIIDSNIG
ncbi:hypothetical protein U3516DRAFT_824414 [Neocallimastix sp. 'constans']